MTRPYYKAIDFAVYQLETAIDLYFEGKDYFSVITLAGAAEEILGKYVEALGKKHALSKVVKTYREIYKIFQEREIGVKEVMDSENFAKNLTKHIDPSKIPGVFINLKDEAEGLLDRAIDNYYSVTDDPSEVMMRYKDFRRGI